MIVRRCTFHGCNLLTIGARCVEHDLPVTRTFVRGRPFPVMTGNEQLSAHTPARLAGSSTVREPLRSVAGSLARR